MSLGQIKQVSEDIYAYLQPDGSWYINNTGFRAYLELDGAERGTPVDLAASLGDMVAYNGGQPLSCHA
jgi:cyclase